MTKERKAEWRKGTYTYTCIKCPARVRHRGHDGDDSTRLIFFFFNYKVDFKSLNLQVVKLRLREKSLSEMLRVQLGFKPNSQALP